MSSQYATLSEQHSGQSVAVQRGDRNLPHSVLSARMIPKIKTPESTATLMEIFHLQHVQRAMAVRQQSIVCEGPPGGVSLICEDCLHLDRVLLLLRIRISDDTLAHAGSIIMLPRSMGMPIERAAQGKSRSW